jgi:calcineurin-like phosphoesterase family protein
MKLIKQPGQNIWFTSDTHYGHKNICRGTTSWTDADRLTRNFNYLDEMNLNICNEINQRVQQDDILFHLGDWSFGGLHNVIAFRNQIVCQNVHLVLGNHDEHIARDQNNLKQLFSSVNQYLELDVRMYNDPVKQTKLVMQQEFVLMHYPIQSWNRMNHGSIHLHGHVHLPPHQRLGKGKMMDVGVEGNDLKPISLLEVMQIMAKQPIASNLPFDHHVKCVQ